MKNTHFYILILKVLSRSILLLRWKGRAYFLLLYELNNLSQLLGLGTRSMPQTFLFLHGKLFWVFFIYKIFSSPWTSRFLLEKFNPVYDIGMIMMQTFSTSTSNILSHTFLNLNFLVYFYHTNTLTYLILYHTHQ